LAPISQGSTLQNSHFEAIEALPGVTIPISQILG
jgi:hypothetical protein